MILGGGGIPPFPGFCMKSWWLMYSHFEFLPDQRSLISRPSHPNIFLLHHGGKPGKLITFSDIHGHWVEWLLTSVQLGRLACC